MADGGIRIPLVDLKAAHAEVAEEVRAGWERVLAATGFLKGPEVAGFEEEFAAFSGVRHCVGAGSGTDALELALRALDLPSGGGVALPANTFVATAEAVVRAGLRPVPVDVDDEYLLMDPARVREALEADGGIVALLPVHLHGQLAPMRPLLDVAAENGLPVVEDAAQAQGARQAVWPGDAADPAAAEAAADAADAADAGRSRGAGAWGRIAATSFYPGKNLGAYGDAGAVLTSDDALASAVRLMADHGSREKYLHERFGFTSRLDALQAVVLRAKLKRLPGWNDSRRAAAARYAALLAEVPQVRLPRTAPGNEHVWHLYAVRLPRRDAVLAALQEAGVGAGVHYPVPVHLQPAFAALGYRPGSFPAAERAAGELLSLPLYPQLTEEQQTRVADAVREAVAAPSPDRRAVSGTPFTARI